MTRREGSGISCHRCGTLAVFLVLLLVTCGCTMTAPSEKSVTTPVPADITPKETRQTPTAEPQPEITLPVVIAIKNFSITHPTHLKPVSEKGYSENTTKAIDVITSPASADPINGFLRWESVRTRMERSEAARIDATVREIDSAIRSTTLNEELILYKGIGEDTPQQIINAGRYSDDGYVTCSYDPSVIYHTLSKTSRDKGGYLTLLVFREGPGSHLLYVNESGREVLLPRGMTWELNAEEEVTRAEFTLASVPRYKDEQMDNLRLLYMTRIT